MKTLQAAILVCSVLLITTDRICGQVAPGGNADAIHPAGPPDPQKLDAIWQVDPISDQVSINIPFTTTPQGGRGPKIPFALLYNSASTVTLQVAGSYVIAVPNYMGQSTIYDWSTQPISGSSTAPSGPWTTTGPYIYYSVSNYPNVVYQNQTYDGCTIDGPFIYVDENGSPHDMNLIGTNISPGSINLAPVCTEAQEWIPPQTNSFWPSSSTTDGSAMATYNTSQSNGAEGKAIGPDGTSVTGSFELPTGPVTPSTVTMTDPNNNSATLALNNGVYTATDALGRTVYTTTIPIGLTGQIPATTTTPYNLTTYNESGGAEAYSISFSKYQIGTFNMPHPTASEIGAGVGVNSPGPGNPNNTFTAVTEIALPDSTSYQFTYDPTYGTISMITFPTGGYVRFCWGVRDKDWTPEGSASVISSIVVIAAFTSTGGGTPGVCSPTPSAGSNENQWTYAMESLDNSSVPVGKVTAPDNSYTNYVGTCSFDFTAVGLFGGKATCKESSRAIYDSSGNLKMSAVQYFNGHAFPIQVVTGLYDGSSPIQKQTVNSYDAFYNILEKDESDFVNCTESPQGSPCQIPPPTTGPWLRKTYTTFSATCNSTLASKFIMNKPCQVIVTDGNGTAYSWVTYSYNNNGNLTNQSKCISISGVYPSVSCPGSFWQTQYSPDTTGQVTQVVEGYGTSVAPAGTTSYTWGGQNNGFLMSVQHSNGATDSYTYYTPTGQMASHTDWNNGLTKYYYADPLNRPTGIAYPDTGSLSINYTDAPGSFSVGMTTATGISSPAIVNTTNYDGLGRKCETQLNSDPWGADYVDTAYDGNGRVHSVTNPYRASGGATGQCSQTPLSSPTNGSTVTYPYDPLDRPLKITNPDTTYKAFSYAGFTITSTDENSHSWSRTSNGLGQLTMVMEPNGVGSSPSMETDYTYDPLNNLLSVNQKGNGSTDTPHARSFSYDSLSRLKQATNPETGTTYYYYLNSSSGFCSADPSAPCTKTDARSVTTTYAYNSVNQLLSKTYSDTAGMRTPWSCYQYGTSAGSIGRLVNAWTQTSGTACQTTAPLPGSSGLLTLRSFLAYDPMGRLWNEKQYTLLNGTSGTSSPPCQSPGLSGISYCYDLAGNLTFSSNGINSPSYLGGTNSIAFTSTFDGASHLSLLTSNWSDTTTHPGTLFSVQTGSTTPCANSGSLGYTAFGALANAAYGIRQAVNVYTVNRSFDTRLRTTCETDTGSGVQP